MGKTSETKWTYDMYKKLLLEYPTKGDDLAAEFGISIENLRSRAFNMDVTTHTEFTEYENEMFRRYHGKLQGATVFLMPYRSPAEIGLHICADTQ